MRVWVSDMSVVCVSEGCESEWSEWVSGWVGGWVSDWGREGVREGVSECMSEVRWGEEWGVRSEEEDHACHAKESETQGRQRNSRAYIRPLGNAHCPTPATQKRRRPRDASGTPGRTSDPLATHIVPRLPRKRGGDPGTPAEPQGVHPTPWQCTLSHACHAKEAETQGRQRNPGAYIRPLGSAHCPTPATQKRRRPRDASGPGVHPTPWQCTLSHACHAKEAETQGRQRNPGAYIRPLGNAHCPTPATQKRRRPRDASGTPGRTSDPLTVHIVPRLPRKRGGDPGTPAEPRGVHPTPWQCTLSHACHAKEAETQGRQRNPRTYIRPLGSAHCPTRATQKRPLTVHIVPRLPWCEWVSEWESEWVSESVSEWVSEWVSESVSEWECECVSEWMSEWECEWVRVWVCECVSEWVCEWVSESEWVGEWVSEWVSVSEGAGGGGRRKADTELKTKTPHVNVGKKEHFSETKKNLRKSEMNPSEYWECSVKLSQKMDEICGLDMASPILYSTRQNWSLTSKNEASSTSRISIPVLKHPTFKFTGSDDSLFHLVRGFPN